MATPDVRIRLSAEGVAEVVSALKTVQAQSVKTAQAPTKSFGLLNGVLGSLKGMLAGVAAYFSIRAFSGWVRGGLEAADSMKKLSERMGTTTERASALLWVARRSDIDMESLGRSTGLFAKKLESLRTGGGAAEDTFRKLNLGAKDFKGKDIAESMGLVAERMYQLAPGATKTAIAMGLFGKNGAQLIPTLNDLGSRGLPEIVKQARELGVVLDQDTVNAAAAARDELKTLNLQSQTMAAQFAGGFAPAMRQGIRMVTGDIGTAGSQFKQFGQIAGKALQALISIVATVVESIAGIVDTIIVGIRWTVMSVEGAVAIGKKLIKGDLEGAKREYKAREAEVEEMFRRADERTKGREKRTKSRWSDLFSAPEPIPAPPPPGIEAPNDEDLQARLELQQTALENELALYKAQAKLREEVEKESFDRGLTSIQSYFANRRKAIEDATAVEIAALLKERALLSAETDEDKRVKAEQKIDTQIAQVRIAAQGELLKLTADERKAIKDLGDKRLELERKIMEAQGRTHEAALAQIEDEIAKRDLELRQSGATDAEREALLQSLRGALTARADFDQARRDADAAMSELELARRAIQTQVQMGQLSELDGERQLIAIEQQRLPALEALARNLLSIAETTKDPELIRAAREFSAALGGMGVAVSETDRLIQNMGDNIRGSLTSDLSNWLADGIEKTDNLGTAFLKLASSVVSSLRRILAEIVATKIIEQLSMIPGLSGGGKVKGTPKAGGGEVRGPGTGTSDSIPAMLSNREFVVRAAVATQPGMLGFLNLLNRGIARPTVISTRSRMAFAEGGFVSSGPSSSIPRDGKIMVGLEDGLVLRALDSPDGERLIVKTVARNRRALSRLW